MVGIYNNGGQLVKTIEHNPTNMEKEPLLQFFEFQHLPEGLQVVSKPFGELANSMCENLPRNPERTVALRKLLEAKDCAVRALIFKN